MINFPLFLARVNKRFVGNSYPNLSLDTYESERERKIEIERERERESERERKRESEKER